MNAAHLHLALNHVPLFGALFGLLLLLFGVWRKSDILQKAALHVFVVAALVAVPVYLTGEPAEHIVEALPGVSESLIERHEQAAEVAFWASGALGLAALITLVARRRKVLPAWINLVLLTGAVVVGGLMARTANLGGEVRHSEIRADAGHPVESKR